jgi:hypothetical protein
MKSIPEHLVDTARLGYTYKSDSEHVTTYHGEFMQGTMCIILYNMWYTQDTPGYFSIFVVYNPKNLKKVAVCIEGSVWYYSIQKWMVW